MSDWQLLQQYNSKGSQTAFDTIIQKYTRMVYWTCHRDLHDQQLTEDAVQTVFILLARKAGSIRSDVSLSGWLFKSARLVSKDILRSELRRKRNEERIAREMESQAQDQREWSEIEPLINDGISSLNEADRNAILMRFFGGLSHKEIAESTGINEDTARMRVHRAIDKLRGYLIKKGVQVTPSLLGTLLDNNAVYETPQAFQHALPNTIHAGQLSYTAGVLSSFLSQGANIIMEITKRKVAVALVSVLLFGAAGTAVYQLRVNSTHWKSTSILIDKSSSANLNFNDKQAILAEYQKTSDAFANRTIYHGTANSNYKVTMNDGKVLDLGKVKEQLNTFYSTLGDYNCAFTINSIQIAGNNATVNYSMNIDGIIDNVRRPYVPAGTHIQVKQNQEDHWTKIDGKWQNQNSAVSASQILINGKPFKPAS